jgi:hypothetical protein
LWTVQRWTGTPSHTAAIRVLEPRRAVDDEKLGTAQAAPDEIVEHRPMDGSTTKPDFIFRFLSHSPRGR